ncbi:hypothetical protein DJ021_18385 [Phenylobacterium hankyongense]|uniref:Uncharacterized protein n=1 Tax=Phenylobacterium hankyongense TaxID=1813876 RepID=A0A328AGA0_9CAUL|nr:hypothetical protein [Phenylobacterium hankyongense]RAK52464.1 hypothetical protein DJ021_18385 [Phenylobacterium hankyongense]
MQTASRRRTISALAASAAAHLVLLTVLALQAPMLRVPPEVGGPPEPVIPILIMPRVPPAAAGTGTRPAPIQLHRRPQRNLPPALPLPPLVVAPAKPEDSAAAPKTSGPTLTPPPPAPPESVRSALRTTFGCTEAQMAGLSQSERERCLETLGRGARDAPFLPPGAGLSRDKRAAFDKAAADKDTRKTAMDRPAAGATTLPAPSDYDGEPYQSGAGASALGPQSFPSSKRAAPKLDRLPP